MRAYFFVYVFLLMLSLIFFSAQSAGAQSYIDSAVAALFSVEGQFSDGDIISFDPSTQLYVSATTENDEHTFGVVVIDPTLFLSEGQNATGTPVVRFGEVMVNVSDIAGPINIGDLISSSVIPGVGEKIDKYKPGYMLGMALKALATSTQSQTATVDGKTVYLGKIPVALRIGAYTPPASLLLGIGDGSGAGGPLKEGQIAIEKGDAVFTVDRITRYILAGLIAMTVLYIAFRSFRGYMTQSIISVGRNPLAKASILSMVFLNSVLIIIVSVIALVIGAVIIYAP